MEASVELPRYKCFKVVRAAKITAIEIPEDRIGMRLILGEIGGHVTVTAEWIENRKAAVGGYFVMYEDGYQSFSPAKAFEDGYSKLEP